MLRHRFPRHQGLESDLAADLLYAVVLSRARVLEPVKHFAAEHSRQQLDEQNLVRVHLQ